MRRRLRFLGGFGLGLVLGGALGAVLGFVGFLALMCAPYSGCRL